MNDHEAARRQVWQAVDLVVRKELEKLHIRMGHLCIVGMMRMLRRSGAKAEVIKACKSFKCQACGDALRAKLPRPVKFVDNYTFNNVLSVDTLTVHDIKGVSYTILNMLCEGTCLRIAGVATWRCALGQV